MKVYRLSDRYIVPATYSDFKALCKFKKFTDAARLSVFFQQAIQREGTGTRRRGRLIQWRARMCWRTIAKMLMTAMRNGCLIFAVKLILKIRTSQRQRFSNVFYRYFTNDHYFSPFKPIFFTFSSRRRQRRRQQNHHLSTI